MPLPKEVYDHRVSYGQLDRGQRNKQLSVLRERIRQIGQEIFELSCQLQRQFDAKDVKKALVLVAELKTLKAYEERLTEKVDW